MKQNEHKHVNACDYVCSKVVGHLPPMLPSNLIPPKHYSPSKPLLSNYELQYMKLDDTITWKITNI